MHADSKPLCFPSIWLGHVDTTRSVWCVTLCSVWRWFYFLGETPPRRFCPPLWLVRSFEIKWTPRISREPFDLKSTEFHTDIHIDRLQQHRICHHKLLPVGSYREKNGGKCHIRRFRVEFLQNGLGKNHEILHTYLRQLAPQNCWRWRH